MDNLFLNSFIRIIINIILTSFGYLFTMKYLKEKYSNEIIHYYSKDRMIGAGKHFFDIIFLPKYFTFLFIFFFIGSISNIQWNLYNSKSHWGIILHTINIIICLTGYIYTKMFYINIVVFSPDMDTKKKRKMFFKHIFILVFLAFFYSGLNIVLSK